MKLGRIEELTNFQKVLIKVQDPLIANSGALFLILTNLPEYIAETVYQNYYYGNGKPVLSYEDCEKVRELLISQHLETALVKQVRVITADLVQKESRYSKVFKRSASGGPELIEKDLDSKRKTLLINQFSRIHDQLELIDQLKLLSHSKDLDKRK